MWSVTSMTGFLMTPVSYTFNYWESRKSRMSFLSNEHLLQGDCSYAKSPLIGMVGSFGDFGKGMRIIVSVIAHVRIRIESLFSDDDEENPAQLPEKGPSSAIVASHRLMNFIK